MGKAKWEISHTNLGKFPCKKPSAHQCQGQSKYQQFQWEGLKGERLNSDPEKLVTAATFRS
ncbi:hypothetical protein TH47_17525 [Thalassospira sp. MCCC 1A02803]|nr:hypothetical protein AUQ41_00295 [Thalassospira sp. MCCC 1A02898]ONH86396.1 hypothetical protein TH47_17525 [Thalassospira sp. MCCC 1A02803]